MRLCAMLPDVRIRDPRHQDQGTVTGRLSHNASKPRPSADGL